MPGSIAPLVAGWSQRNSGLPGVLVGGTVAGVAPALTEIPYSWLLATATLTFRPDKPLNVATVTQTGGLSARAADIDSQTAWGVTAFSAELTTASDADPGSLANFVINYYATAAGGVPRVRSSAFVFDVAERTTDEMYTLLERRLGDRIRITDVPADWPVGSADLTVEGRSHSIAVDTRYLSWWVAPVVGATAGTAGPWFRYDSSSYNGTDVRIW